MLRDFFRVLGHSRGPGYKRQRASDVVIRNHYVLADVLAGIEDLEQECFVAVLVNSRLRVIKTVIIGLGSLNEVDAHPREVFREAVRYNAYSIFLAHNHPSGDNAPSTTDIDLTRNLKHAGELLGIPVRDHVIFAKHREPWSLDANGLL